MRASLKILLILGWLPLMMLLATAPWLLKWESARRYLVRLTFRGVSSIFNIRIRVKGTLSAHRPLLLVCNHSSYVDILALGSELPIAFTPKKEIRSWPIIGFCCRLAGCVFVERTPKAIAETKEEIARKLGSGRVMCIFPEGTTNDGTHLKPFKSSFFSLGEVNNICIQPLALCYTRRDGQLLTAEGRAEIAWYDDMSLLPHLWRLLNFKRIDVELSLLPLLRPDTRKALCARSQTMIEQHLEKMHERINSH